MYTCFSIIATILLIYCAIGAAFYIYFALRKVDGRFKLSLRWPSTLLRIITFMQ